jgi:hypothetical protein
LKSERKRIAEEEEKERNLIMQKEKKDSNNVVLNNENANNNAEIEVDDIPAAFICPISQDIMDNPVIAGIH